MLKIEAGKKYRTRGGDEVEILRTDMDSDEPIIGVITSKEGGGQWTYTCYPDGSFFFNGEDCNDLISEIKPKRVVWLNVYEGHHGATFFSSRQEADADYLKWADSTPTRIACIRVEFEDGQFDE